MFGMRLLPFLANAVILFNFAIGDNDAASLSGTWSSKSNQVFTGPGFYDPVDELLIEPALPGISYSFTEDGYFEEAQYRVVANPRNIGCPQAVLIYQHGKYEILTNGTLILTPFEVDGRQLLSDPCNDDGVSTYSRYNQSETFLSFDISIDDYHGIYKLQLNQFDGSPLQPLYLAYRPPMMLPTITLNPTATNDPTDAVGKGSVSKRSLRQIVKRNLENKHKQLATKKYSGILVSPYLWYVCTGVIGVGSALFLFS
ncbi:hypothetical protein Kpol_1018p18 [Vanderwaltozyma polyspora DSM 70294]|uniref:Protein ROT1 n=1 Tax=Vanderwaltozyma polyspora (strain ATCC 22028 / DSM 70294 / BCRC 21397 / CBS 2163 / NBRC 10782 / NRRL Y-8283 / UCD 57-17) TaxID=436907 RepID=ROT1_VANPO|nr:uncharacterized protein Kpol_1018p18 [Vanderwaltozyma polyspora DSM 70294]A7TDM0.1 RecName: Full=Protein ROT1; Flags: Precursor [Vanderwaltozyma polyspora DSM 70294]EDO19490.1 hypothetical protein Kpol_1018p18 [Vanderwaltozyma polyspora DSM 70294]